MQANFVKAFRQRLVRAGFTNIQIYSDGDRYIVWCTDPKGKKIRANMTQFDIEHTPKVVWFAEEDTTS